MNSNTKLNDILHSDGDSFGHLRQIYNTNPIPVSFWDANFKLLDCNAAMLKMLAVSDKTDFINDFFGYVPETFTDGISAKDKFSDLIAKAGKKDGLHFYWEHLTADSELVPGEASAARIDLIHSHIYIVYFHDLRSHIKAEARDRESRQLNEMFYRDSPVLLNTWDENLKLRNPNNRTIEIFGLKNEEEFFDKFYELSPEYQPCGTLSTVKAVELVKQAFREGRVQFEWMHQSINKEPLPVEITLIRFTHSGKNMVAAYTVDLRPIKAAMQRERELEHELDMILHIRNIFDSSPIALLVNDDDNNYVECNMKAADMFGFEDKAKFLKEFSLNFFGYCPEYQPCGTSSIEKRKQLEEQYSLNSYAQSEWLHVLPCSKELYVEVTMTRTAYKDTFLKVIYIRDLSEIKAAQKKEQEAHTMVNMLFEASPLFMEVWDEHLTLIDCNNQFVKLYGLANKEEFIKAFPHLSPEYQQCGTPSQEKQSILLQEALKNGYSQSEWMLHSTDGKDLPVEVEYVRLQRQGKYIIVGYNHDLRHVKRAMAEIQRSKIAEESNKAKSNFLARMSHEIRTPITAVLGISEIQLQSNDLSPALKESFVKIHNSSNILLGIVNDILDLSKIEAGKMELAQKEYEIEDLISNTLHLHHSYLNDKDIKFNLRLEENLPVALVGDAPRIEQILHNLLSNAFKYTLSGFVDLSFACEKIVDDYAVFLVTVSDSGVGMSQEQIDQIFDEYVRFYEYENRNIINGTGLGMSIVYHLLSLMDGLIKVESELGKGTTVAVRIPQKIASHDVLSSELVNDLQELKINVPDATNIYKLPAVSMPYGTVLVVDDIEANLYVTQALLEFYDLQVETCSDGYAVLDKLAEGKVYDIVFMDHMMPGINGTETMQKMRELGYTQPIVALTANAMIGKAEEFIKEGFDAFMSKPIQTKLLNTILLKYVKNEQKLSQNLPTSEKTLKNLDDFQNSAELQEQLRLDFAVKQKNALRDLKVAIDADDIDKAHIMVHSLKGIAGLMYETTLQEIAEYVECILEEGRKPEDYELASLEEEFTRVLESIVVAEKKTAPAVSASAVFDVEELVSLINKLVPMLESRKAECMDLLDDFRGIPQAAIMVRQIEKFEFKAALASAIILRELFEE